MNYGGVLCNIKLQHTFRLLSCQRLVLTSFEAVTRGDLIHCSSLYHLLYTMVIAISYDEVKNRTVRPKRVEACILDKLHNVNQVSVGISDKVSVTTKTIRFLYVCDFL